MDTTKVYLVKNKRVEFGDAENTRSYGSLGSYRRLGVISRACSFSNWKWATPAQEMWEPKDLEAALANIDLGIAVSGTKDIFDGGALKNERLEITSELFYESLKNAGFQKKDIEIKAKLFNFCYRIVGESRKEGGVWTSSSKYMNITVQPPLIYVDQSARFFPLPAKVWQNNSYTFFGDVTISLKVKRQNDPLLGFSTNQRILEGNVFSDVVIVANNGAELKCHKNFLSAHSSVFQAMFESNMIEGQGQTSRVEIIDMAEESVKAFLAYLYYENSSDAEKDCAIAFELLWAGHKYDIRKLEVSMVDLLVSKDMNWYTVDVALRLFLFTRNLELEKAGQLVNKAVQVMKKNFSDLEASAEYQQLFKTDPDAAMFLCKLAFSLQK